MEEVNSDMDVTEDGGGVESAGEVGVSVEVWKRRNVVRKGTSSMGA